MNNTIIYKGHTIRIHRSSTNKVIEAVVIGQQVWFKTIKSAKSFINETVK